MFNRATSKESVEFNQKNLIGSPIQIFLWFKSPFFYRASKTFRRSSISRFFKPGLRVMRRLFIDNEISWPRSVLEWVSGLSFNYPLLVLVNFELRYTFVLRISSSFVLSYAPICYTFCSCLSEMVLRYRPGKSEIPAPILSVGSWFTSLFIKRWLNKD